MQSGICGESLGLRAAKFSGTHLIKDTSSTASQELHAAFQSLVSNTLQRGLFVTISKEQLVPGPAITSESGDFANDLHLLTPHLKDNEAVYIILRRYSDAADGFVAVTYVPDAAPVRQKMLISSTSLTLVRELGIERFREKIFATTKAELTAEGFRKHDQHVKLAAPLTEEEESLGAVKKAEAEEGRGMSIKKAHVSDRLTMSISDNAVDALKGLPGSEGGNNLVQLVCDSIDSASLGLRVFSLSALTCSRKLMLFPRRSNSQALTQFRLLP